MAPPRETADQLRARLALLDEALAEPHLPYWRAAPLRDSRQKVRTMLATADFAAACGGRIPIDRLVHVDLGWRHRE